MGEIKRDNKKDAIDNSGSVWLLTFNDMMTLLLTFFVLILSMSRMDSSKMEEASSAVGSIFGVPGAEEKAAVRVFDPFILSPEEFHAGDERRVRPEKKASDYETFLRKRDDFISRFNGRAAMEAKATANGIRIRMGGNRLFQEGSAEVASGGHDGLTAVCSLLEGTRPFVRVEVFTGETPADRERHPSGWELAAARGAGVARILASRGGAAPERISVSAYGVKSAAWQRGTSGDAIEVTLTFYES